MMFILLQIRLTLVSAGLPSPAIMPFNSSIRALLLQIGREPIMLIMMMGIMRP